MAPAAGRRGALVDALFAQLDADGGGKVTFAEFRAWLEGRDAEPLRREKAIASWRLTATSAAVTVLAGVTIRDLGFVVARDRPKARTKRTTPKKRARPFTPVCS